MKLNESELCDLDRYSIRASESNAYFPAPKTKKSPEEIFAEERLRLGLGRKNSNR